MAHIEKTELPPRSVRHSPTLSPFIQTFSEATVQNLHLMEPFAALFGHLISYCVFTVARTAVNAGTEHKMCTSILRCAKELEDAATAITNVDTTRRVIQQSGRLT